MCMLTIIQRERRDYIQGMGNESVNTCTTVSNRVWPVYVVGRVATLEVQS